MAGRIFKGPPALRPTQNPDTTALPSKRSVLPTHQAPTAPVPPVLSGQNLSQAPLNLKSPQRRRTLEPSTIHVHTEPTIAQERAQQRFEKALNKLSKTKKKRSKDPLALKLSRRAKGRIEELFDAACKHLDAQGIKYTANRERYTLSLEPDGTTALGRFAKGLDDKHQVRVEYRPVRLWAKGVRGSFISGKVNKLLLSHAGILAGKPTSTEIHETRHSYYKQLFHVRNEESLFCGNAFPPDDGWQDAKKSYAQRFSLEELSTFALQHVHAAGGLGVVRAALAGKIAMSDEAIAEQLENIMDNLDERFDKSSGPFLAARLFDTCTKLERDVLSFRQSFLKDTQGQIHIAARDEEHRAHGQFILAPTRTKKSDFEYISCTYKDFASGRRLEIPLLHQGVKTLFWDSLEKLSDSSNPEHALGHVLSQYIKPRNEALMKLCAEQKTLYKSIAKHKEQLHELLDEAPLPWKMDTKQQLSLAVENLHHTLRQLRQTIREP